MFVIQVPKTETLYAVNKFRYLLCFMHSDSEHDLYNQVLTQTFLTYFVHYTQDVLYNQVLTLTYLT